MKKLIQYFLDDILSNFKCYRKRKGGVWFKVRDTDVGGLATGIEYWTQEKSMDESVAEIASEDYS